MLSEFEQALSGDAQPVAADFSSPSKTLLVAFGGIAKGLGVPPFEFFRMAEKLQTKRMFVRDIDQAWYQRGLSGVSHDILSTADYLRRVIEPLRVARTVFVGNSMGGYAAMLFGSLLNVHEVHAFSPQTYLGFWQRLLTLDRRWRQQIRSIQRDRQVKKSYFDLKNILADSPRRTVMHVHFADQHRLDSIHGHRLANLPSVVLHPYPHRGHNLIKRLRKDGTLQSILDDALVQHRARLAA